MKDGIELIYSQQATDFVKGRAYSNPRFFTSPRAGVSKVYLVGEWPEIRAAYEALGVPVERIDAVDVVAAPLETAGPDPDLTERIAEAFPDGPAAPDDAGLTKAEIVADLEGMGVEFDARHTRARLLAQRNTARAARDQAGA